MTLSNITELLLTTHWTKINRKFPYKKEVIRNLLVTSKQYALLQLHPNDELIADELAATIKESVRKYTRNKETAIAIYKVVIQYLQEFHGIEIAIAFPPIPISNTFERVMFITKYLQDPDHRIGELEEVLWVSSKTIEEDLKLLRGESENSIQICGNTFRIPDTTRSKGQLSFASTAHPFFLTSNLTQVLVMLKGLKEMSKQPIYEGYAKSMARSIWQQLSDYAKARIFYVGEHLMLEDMEWYRLLEGESGESFFSERMCSSVGANVMLECLKSGDCCYIEYLEDTGEKAYYKECTVTCIRKEQCIIVQDGIEYVLELSGILRSAYSKDMIV